jgi:hypothetical protein
MDIEHTNKDGVLSFSILDVEFVLKQEHQAFLLDDHIFREYPGNLRMTDKNIHGDSLIQLMQWLYKAYSMINALAIKEYVKQCTKRVQKRAYSTSHRIEIAYKSKYQCNMCKMLLPPTFEVDHIIELCDGGKDEYDNLQALCPNCHALKTRANILRRDKSFNKEFGKRFDLMQTNSFKEFEYKPKRSKYF